MNITVVGTGYVGLVTGVGLSHIGHSVTCLDIDQHKIDGLQQGIAPIYEPDLEDMMKQSIQENRLSFTSEPQAAYGDADIVYIAVGTPANFDGSADLSYLAQACSDIGTYITKDVVVVTKSTVPVGTNDRIKKMVQEQLKRDVHIQMVSNPEFLREGSAVHDFFHGDRIVVGAETLEAAATMERIYSSLNISIFQTDIRSAEMIKYASNAFLATKISFINEISNICEKVDADVEAVALGMGMDTRIGSSFLRAGIGYGGSCFPKDTDALVQIAGNVQHDFQLLKAVIDVNNKQQASLVEKAKSVMKEGLQGKQVAVLGLAFKPNTDDMREAASLVVIKQLLDEKAIVTAYDPVAMQKAKSMLPSDVRYVSSIDEAIVNQDAVFIVTEWKEILNYPLQNYEALMNCPLLLDGRNCYSLEAVQRHQIDYYSIGRAPVICNRIVT
ncbi:UDP-glucose/GDP-mannose dehydrogenase family protein [Bacillus sp. 165]|uniref:UDP-glucose dehydrogenase family protein n=1 Tax=Bacillus sp. 165 TaxID=1529117 RepID=UPI001ADD6114|nr:UDP-glucose/GDP-mannose dehydrogenase family protein [Bacillus sp. 165]MBO9129957.1 UDP-glucose/GDP-mannose dehydrogenase family protein [Bacillus sp. 165]